MEKLEKLTTIKFYWTKHSTSLVQNFFAIFMHVIFRFASTSSIICGLDLESCRHSASTLETIHNTTHQQMQWKLSRGWDFTETSQVVLTSAENSLHTV
jgi:hypothetical protein